AKGLANITDLPTHPLFVVKNSSKKNAKSNSELFFSNSLQTLTNMNNLFPNNSFINPFQIFASFFQPPQFLQPSQFTNSQIAFFSSQVLTMLDFLKNLDIHEGQVDTEEAFIHYLPGFQ
ncbi:16018_t:CDS:1, partial [Funneliformis geosporum]